MAKEKKQLPSEKATEIVAQRQEQYGHPRDVYTVVGQLWSVYLAGRKKIVVEFTPEDVAHFLLLLKEGREINQHLPDNLDDISGYSNVVSMVIK